MAASLRRFAILLLASIILTSALPASGQFAPEGPSDDAGTVLTVQAQFTAPTADKPAQLFVTAAIRPGWHIYALTQPSGGPLATKIQVTPPQGVRVGKFQPSVAPHLGKEPDAFGDLPIESHQGTVTWYAPLELAAGIDPATLEIRGKLSAQACDATSCVPPQDLPFQAILGDRPNFRGHRGAAVVDETGTVPLGGFIGRGRTYGRHAKQR